MATSIPPYLAVTPGETGFGPWGLEPLPGVDTASVSHAQQRTDPWFSPPSWLRGATAELQSFSGNFQIYVPVSPGGGPQTVGWFRLPLLAEGEAWSLGFWPDEVETVPDGPSNLRRILRGTALIDISFPVSLPEPLPETVSLPSCTMFYCTPEFRLGGASAEDSDNGQYYGWIQSGIVLAPVDPPMATEDGVPGYNLAVNYYAAFPVTRQRLHLHLPRRRARRRSAP